MVGIGDEDAASDAFMLGLVFIEDGDVGVSDAD